MESPQPPNESSPSSSISPPSPTSPILPTLPASSSRIPSLGGDLRSPCLEPESEPSTTDSCSSSLSEHSGLDTCEQTDPASAVAPTLCAVSAAPVSDEAADEAAPRNVKEQADPDGWIESYAETSKEQSQARSRASSVAKSSDRGGGGIIRRLSAAAIQQLSDPDALPIGPAPERRPTSSHGSEVVLDQAQGLGVDAAADYSEGMQPPVGQPTVDRLDLLKRIEEDGGDPAWQNPPGSSTRPLSTPPMSRSSAQNPAATPRRNSFHPNLRSPAGSVSFAQSSERVVPPPSSAQSGSSPSANTPMFPTLSAAVAAAVLPTAKHVPQPILVSSSSAQNPHIQHLQPDSLPSPLPTSIPLPPFSLPAHLQLELAAQRPSPLYIRRSNSADVPYESSAIKFARLLDMLLLAPYLERTLSFGTFACLDAWLYTFTILPMRFVVAVGVLLKWWGQAVAREATSLVGFVWIGLGRVWRRVRGQRSQKQTGFMGRAAEPRPSVAVDGANVGGTSAAVDGGKGVHTSATTPGNAESATSSRSPLKVTITEPRQGQHAPPVTSTSRPFRHRRTPSQPSELSQFHKADLLQGLVIICSSIALMHLDASRMYHFIRAQSAIKLYVIYNVLEIGDRLLGAVGQDIFECLFSAETLSRNASGRSKVLLPAGMFLLALAYNILHSIALYYQVITLNVAVNSYSNALLTLLLSNQFVEVKGTVFKRIEKDNLFQLTCADIVERFQLWIMLLIIGMRNVVEVGGLSVPGAGMGSGGGDDGEMGGAGSGSGSGGGNGGAAGSGSLPLHSPSILPHSFTVLPTWLYGGEVLSPFLIVLASEVLVDTIKHAYVMKFNNIKPTFYSRILDIICKDYYTNAFVTPSLTRRLGLPVTPLSCLFIRASVQTYHMFLSTRLPSPLPPSAQTALATESAAPSSLIVTAALDRFGALIRGALGRSVHSRPYASLSSPGGRRLPRAWWAWRGWAWTWTSDDAIATVTMGVVFFLAFLALLVLKLLLGMALLGYARRRYAEMKVKENARRSGSGSGSGSSGGAAANKAETFEAGSRRLGGWGVVEVGEDRQRWVYADEGEGLKKRKQQSTDGGPAGGGGGANGSGRAGGVTEDWTYSGKGVERFEMVAKRIW